MLTVTAMHPSKEATSMSGLASHGCCLHFRSKSTASDGARNYSSGEYDVFRDITKGGFLHFLLNFVYGRV